MPTLTSNNGAPSNNNEAPGSSMTIAENISARVERALQNDQERTNLLQVRACFCFCLPLLTLSRSCYIDMNMRRKS
jgi:hypothetical protein